MRKEVDAIINHGIAGLVMAEIVDEGDVKQFDSGLNCIVVERSSGLECPQS